MEHPVLTTFAAFIGIILMMVSIFTAIFTSRRNWWLSLMCAFFAGFIPGFCAYNFWKGIIIGILIVLIFVPGTMLTGYYRRKALTRLKNIDKW